MLLRAVMLVTVTPTNDICRGTGLQRAAAAAAAAVTAALRVQMRQTQHSRTD
jgi:hypothetical protein